VWRSGGWSRGAIGENRVRGGGQGGEVEGGVDEEYSLFQH